MPARSPGAHAASAAMPAAPFASLPALPSPAQLAALGPLLGLYRAQAGGELGGWAQAVRAAACSGIDSDGLHECLLFFDRDDRCCWRLYLLPDSDFLAWERLASDLPAHHARNAAESGIGERLWQRLAGRLRGDGWLGSALRLHALPTAPGFALHSPPLLAASVATLSPLGAAVARRIALGESADDSALADDCCCRRAAMAAVRDAADDGHDDRHEIFPLIRFNLGAQA